MTFHWKECDEANSWLGGTLRSCWTTGSTKSNPRLLRVLLDNRIPARQSEIHYHPIGKFQILFLTMRQKGSSWLIKTAEMDANGAEAMMDPSL